MCMPQWTPCRPRGAGIRSSTYNTMKSLLVALLVIVGGCAAPPLSREQLTQIVGNPERSAADRTNDARRDPVEMLSFIGVRAGMQVLDLSAGGGYTTELLARAVGPQGVVYAQTP